jgi:hypothetical protein
LGNIKKIISSQAIKNALKLLKYKVFFKIFYFKINL